MARMNWKRYAGAGIASLGIVCTALGWRVSAEPMGEPEGHRPEQGEVETITGLVAKFVDNDRGDVDGFVFEEGKHVHFPPHVGAAVTKAIQVGDQVTVRGRQETRPRGERVFAAQLIDAGEAKIKIEPPRPTHARRPGRSAEGPPMEATGVVKKLSVNPHDDVDGFTLDDGTIVKFPPHQGSELAAIISIDAEVKVTGRRHETPQGDVHLHADRVTVAATGNSLERDEPRDRPLPPPPHARGPHDRGPQGGDVGPAAPHEEILRELREIRFLLEERRDG